jgi:two-component system, chemotaxis family, protein-glutamate methylesterase/glutaminase
MAPIKVLVVDDSAVVRGVMSRIISAQPDMTVAGLANDPLVAIERLRTSQPDVITLDVEMPRMHGLDFLAKLMRIRPLPVLMVSSQTTQGAEVTLRALELGAVDFVAKPELSGGGASLDAYSTELAEKLRGAAAARVRRVRAADGEAAAPSAAPQGARRDKVIVIGASTGGVEALREVLTPLPATMPPILIAQHMPGGFTHSFAQRLDSLCQIRVKEAQQGETPLPGHAYIAPGGRHLLLAGRPGRLTLQLTDTPPVNRHRPSVDTLFRSTAQAAGSRVIGVMLSGMGADGALGMVELRRCGSYNLAQDEASCVVFGMPKQAIAMKAVDDVLPLRTISRRLVDLCFH